MHSSEGLTIGQCCNFCFVNNKDRELGIEEALHVGLEDVSVLLKGGYF